MVCRKLLDMERSVIERQKAAFDKYSHLRALYDLIDIHHAMDAGLHAPHCGCEPDEEDAPIFVEHGGEG